MDAVEYTAAVAPFDLIRVQTRKGATNTLIGMWAAYLAELQTISVRPRSPLGPSIEANWDAFIRRRDDAIDTIRA